MLTLWSCEHCGNQLMVEDPLSVRCTCNGQPKVQVAYMALCICGYKATSTVTQEIVCPLCSRSILVRSKDDQGRYAWLLAHTQTPVTREEYDRWLTQVPQYDCLCREHWRQLETEYPPPLGSLADMQLWFIHRHNDVNRRLGKPIWPAEHG